MSRTTKGRKGPGYEYWTRRPGNRHGASPGAYTKQETHRAERRMGKAEAQGGLAEEPGHWSEDEICDGCPVCLCRHCGGHVAVGVMADGSGRDGPAACIRCGYEPPEANEGRG